jgi:hypothetical protein
MRRIVRFQLAIIVIVAAVALVSASSWQLAPSVEAASARQNRQDFHDAMRKLWEDHIIWTRGFIVSFAHDLPDLVPTRDRLLRNQDDIGDAIKPFYGDAAGEALSALLHEHILGAAALLDAAKNGTPAEVEEASAAWYANANEIAAFLSAANPRNWPLPEMQAMMREHLDLTFAEAAARLGGNYPGDIAAYDAVHVQILEMADMLSDGIIAQFPQKFGM